MSKKKRSESQDEIAASAARIVEAATSLESVTCDRHPRYQAKARPRAVCSRCSVMYGVANWKKLMREKT